MDKTRATVRAARWSAQHPWWAVLAWVAFVATTVALGAVLGTNQATGKDFWMGEAGRAEAIATGGDVMRPTAEKLMITADSGRFDVDAAHAAAADLGAGLDGLPGVDSVDDPLLSPDRDALLVTVVMEGNTPAAKKHMPALVEAVEEVRAEHPGLRIEQTGDVSRSQGLDALIGEGLLKAEMITLPVTLVILLFVFGAILAAAVPVLLAISSVFSALGLYAVASYAFPDAGGAVTNVVLMMGMAVGVDYSLFYLKRVREERARSGGTISHAAAVELAAATAGRAIVVSGAAVLVSLVGLYLADDVIFSSIATGSIIVVLVAMASSLTILPALLAALGRRTDQRLFLGRRSRTGEPGRLWATMLRPASRHPVATLLIATVALLGLALPVLGITLRVEGNDTFPRSVPAIAVYDRVAATFPDQGPSHLIAVKSTPDRADDVAAALTDVVDRAGRSTLFAPHQQLAIRVSADQRVTTLELPTPHGNNSPEAIESLDKLRTELLPETVGKIPGAEYAVSGEVARSVDYVGHQAAHTPWVVGFVLLLTFLMMAAAFRSIVMGLIGVVLNTLSAAAAFGTLTLVFQSTWAEGLLGFTSTGFIGSRIPLILLVILFGLSMDYQVFVVSRIREAVLRGTPTRQAVLDGISGSAGVVTSAAVVMVSVFVSFMFVGLLELKQIGFGLTVAVLLDALVVRILILPAVMTLLGERSWWPTRIPARHAAAGHVARSQDARV